MGRPSPPAVAVLGSLLLGVGVACSPSRRRAASEALAAACEAPPARTGTAPVPVLPPPWEDPFLVAAEGLARALSIPGPATALEVGRPSVLRLPMLEAFVRDRAREDGRRDVRTVFAFRATCRSALPPSRCAEEILDAAREKAALGADEVTERVREHLDGAERRAFSVAMLRMGEGPLRYDFRWTFLADRMARADGSVLIRYERTGHFGAAEHVSVFRGCAALVPDGSGTRWSEVILVASDVAAPFFLASKVESAVEEILERRWRRLSGGA